MTTPVNGVLVLQGIVPSQIAAAPAGVKVIDLYDDNGQLFTASQVTQMEAGNDLLLGYFSLGEAENYRGYFGSLPSSTLGPADPGFAGDYQVAYWTDAWKTVATNYIDQMIGLGYGGAFFDVVSAYETSWAQANAPGGDAKGAMISLVQYLADYAHAKDPNFKIWVNAAGAEDLMTSSAFVKAIDGAFEEELFYKDNGSPQSAAAVNADLKPLDNLLAAGKPAITIEYVTGATAVANVQTEAAADGLGSYVANPNLALSGVDTEGLATLSPTAPPTAPTQPTSPTPPIQTAPPTPPTAPIQPASPPVTSNTITGTNSNNTLIGGPGNDTLIGLGGNDVLNGGAGADTMIGGTGNDTYYVDNANDVVTEAPGQGSDTVWASVDYVLAPGTEVETVRVNAATGVTLTGNGFSHTLIGNTGNDTLIGGSGNDTLSGGAGNDTLIGGAGNDTLKGGAGNDVFKFMNGFGHDIIKDFTSGPAGGQDLLDISGLGITAASFSANVKIAAGLNGSTLVTIGSDSIRLLNTSPRSINMTDFRLA